MQREQNTSARTAEDTAVDMLRKMFREASERKKWGLTAIEIEWADGRPKKLALTDQATILFPKS